MTIFSKIIAGEIPSYKIAENEKFFAFLDIFPLREGHVLVVPKTETDKFFDLSDEYLSEMLVFAKPIAKAIERSFKCNRCGLEVVGLEFVSRAPCRGLVQIRDRPAFAETSHAADIVSARRRIHRFIRRALSLR